MTNMSDPKNPTGENTLVFSSPQATGTNGNTSTSISSIAPGEFNEIVEITLPKWDINYNDISSTTSLTLGNN